MFCSLSSERIHLKEPIPSTQSIHPSQAPLPPLNWAVILELGAHCSLSSTLIRLDRLLFLARLLRPRTEKRRDWPCHYAAGIGASSPPAILVHRHRNASQKLKSVPLLLLQPHSYMPPDCLSVDLLFSILWDSNSHRVWKWNKGTLIFFICTLTLVFFFCRPGEKNRPAFLKGKILQFCLGARKYRLLNETDLWKDLGPGSTSTCLKWSPCPASLSFHICKMPLTLHGPLLYQNHVILALHKN